MPRSLPPRRAFEQAGYTLIETLVAMSLLVIVITAVASGFATIVESAALGAAYAIVAELIVHRDVHPVRDLPRVLVHASTLVGSVVILLGVALGLTSYLVDAEVPIHLLAWVQAHIKSESCYRLAALDPPAQSEAQVFGR